MHRVLLSAFAVLVVVAGAHAGDRMQPIPLEQMSPEQKRVADAIVSGPRKTLSGPFNAWLRSPELADRLQRVGEYLRFNTSLDHRLNEFAILITGQFWGCEYEWYAHYPLAIKAGLKPEVAAELAEGKRPSNMQADEAIVYDFSTQLHRSKNVDEATYKAAVARFGEQGVMDLIAVNGYYDVVAMTLNVAQVMPPGGEQTLLARPAK